MKKKLLLILTLFLNVFCFAQTIDYRITQDSVLESISHNPSLFKKGTILQTNINDLEYYIDYSLEEKMFGFYIYSLFFQPFNGIAASDEEIELADSIKLFENKFIELLPVYYLDILKKKDASLIYKYQPKWYTYKNNYTSFEGEKFEVGFWPETIILSNLYMSFTEANHYLTKKISTDGEYYKLDLLKQKDFYNDNVPMPECFVKNAEKKDISILLKFDGDYIDLWINNTNQENYIGKYFLDIDRKTLWEIKMLVKSGNFDSKNVYWPRHADGSSDFDNEIKPPMVQLVETQKSSQTSLVSKDTNITNVSETNVALKKTMSTNCNLKLRSGEATSTQVLTVMSAGTKVKILELGKSETIDGINSNWVKVEVQKGAKDRDGKAIKAGTVGWCYGGYLE